MITADLTAADERAVRKSLESHSETELKDVQAFLRKELEEIRFYREFVKDIEGRDHPQYTREKRMVFALGIAEEFLGAIQKHEQVGKAASNRNAPIVDGARVLSM
ncbi:MAG: hypothetical protein AAF549_05695 [Pseudomonadota bacterium]